jgi:hypothetical protein
MRRSLMLRGFAVLALLWAGSAGAESGQPAPPSPPQTPAENPAFALAKAAADALGPAEVAAIQRELIWTGDLNTLASGDYGKRSFDAMRAFQKRLQAKETGILLPAEREALHKAADRAAATYGFRMLTEQGVTLGYPAKLVTKKTPGRFGPKYSSPSGNVTVDVLRYAAGDEGFEALFNRLKAERPGRKVSYSLMRPDFFVIAGSVDGKSFYMRFLKTAQDSRGFVVGWDPALSPDFDRVSIAMAGSLTLEGAARPALAETAAAVEAAPAPGPVGPPLPLSAGAPRTAKTGIGFIVSQSRDLVTSARLIAGCSSAGPPGGAPGKVVSADPVNDLALVRLAAASARPVALRTTPVAAGTPVTILARGADGSLARTSATIASLAGPGDDMRRFRTNAAGSGGGVFDQKGALVGLMQSDGEPVGLKALFVAAFLRANGVTPVADAGADPAETAIVLTCDPSKG